MDVIASSKKHFNHNRQFVNESGEKILDQRLEGKRSDNMKSGKKWLYLILGGIGALVIVFGVGFISVQDVGASPLIQGEGPGRPGGPSGDYTEALAEALGITVDELYTAQESVREARLAEAVESGMMTEEQAARIVDHERSGLPIRGRLLGEEFMIALADELGISPEELDQAQAQVREDFIVQGVQEGVISTDQMELMEARNAVRAYMKDALHDAMEDAIEHALSDGAISSDQADLLRNRMEGGFPDRGAFKGDPGFFGKPMPGGSS